MTRLKLERRDKSGREILGMLAVEWRRECDVLCFDEFAITTIQDCVLLAPLFSEMYRAGMVVVSTSNRAPENLYEDGLNRHLYLPSFLETLYANTSVLAVDNEKDYRRAEFENEVITDTDRVFFDATGGHQKLSEDWLQRSGLNDLTHELDLEVGYGRRKLCKRTSKDGKAARFHFSELFKGPPFFGADDYNALAGQFHTIVLDGLYILDVADHNEAKRLTNFLDCVYENHCRLVCVNMADVNAETIFMNLLPLESLDLKALLEAEAHEGGTVGSADQDTSAGSSGVAVKAMGKASKGILAEKPDLEKKAVNAVKSQIVGSEKSKLLQNALNA